MADPFHEVHRLLGCPECGEEFVVQYRRDVSHVTGPAFDCPGCRFSGSVESYHPVGPGCWNTGRVVIERFRRSVERERKRPLAPLTGE